MANQFPTNDFFSTLESARAHRESIGNVANDFLLFVTSQPFHQTYTSHTYFGGMCDSSRSVAVVEHKSDSRGLAIAIARAIGNSLGLYDTADCSCDPECIMSESFTGNVDATFSECSQFQLEPFFCLMNYPDSFETDSVCGNDWVEPGEQCDSDSSCCSDCFFTQECDDSSDPCCENCLRKSPGAICRSPIGDCDLPDFCSSSGECSVRWKQDSSECANDGKCYGGRCASLHAECSVIYRDSTAAPRQIFAFNLAGDAAGNCGANSTNCFDERCDYEPCSSHSPECGKVFCELSGNTDVTEEEVEQAFLLPFDAVHHFRTHSFIYQKDFLSIQVNPEDSIADSIGYVLDGTPCGSNGMCVNSECINSIVTTCDCDQDVFCDQYGDCHVSIGPSQLPSKTPHMSPSKTPHMSPSNFPSTPLPTPHRDPDDGGSVGMIGTDTDITSIFPLVYVPDANDVNRYQAEIRAIFMGMFSIPLAAVSVSGPTDTYYHQVIVNDIRPGVNITETLLEVNTALAQSDVLPEGTKLGVQEICEDRDDEITLYTGNLFSSCMEFLSAVGQESCSSTIFGFNPMFVCCASCAIEQMDCASHGYENLAIDILYNLQQANFTLLSISADDIKRLCHDGNGKFFYLDRGDSEMYDTCVGYGHGLDCDSTEVVCSGTGTSYGTSQQIAEQLELSLSNYYRHPACPVGCFIQDSYDGLYDFRNCTGDGTYSCFAECIGIGIGGNFVCLEDGREILNEDTHDELPCKCQDREGYWDFCAEAKADPTMCEYYGPGYCPATCGLCKVTEYHNCAPPDIPDGTYWHQCGEDHPNNRMPGVPCTIVCLADGVTDQLFCPNENVMPNAPLQPMVPGTAPISPSECVEEIVTTPPTECADLGSASLCQAALDNPAVHCAEGSVIREECLQTCGLCVKHCAPLNVDDNAGTYDTSDCDQALLTGESCFVQCAFNPNLVSEFTCPTNAQEGDALVGTLPSCWFCRRDTFDSMYDHNCGALSWAGASCTVSCANPVLSNSETWDCPAQLDTVPADIYTFGISLVGTMPDCSYCRALTTSRADLKGCDSDLAPGDTCVLSCLDDRDPKIITCPSTTSQTGAFLQVMSYPSCDVCDPLDNIDPSKYEISNCNRTLAVGERCEIQCKDIDESSTFSCVSGESNLIGTWPECNACEPMENSNSLYNSTECESILAEGDFCRVRCADEPTTFSPFFCEADGNLQGSLPTCGRCAPLALDSAIYDHGDCSNSLNAGDQCFVSCQSSLKSDNQRFSCPMDANSTTFPLEGNLPDCFFCDAPDFDTSSYTSDCSDVQDAGSRCNITCRNDVSVFSTFTCADTIVDIHTPMDGVLPQCPVCEVLGNTNSLYDSSQCEIQIAKGDSCTVRCADEPSIATLFQCESDGPLIGNLPTCGRCDMAELNPSIYDLRDCSESLRGGESCIAGCVSPLKFSTSRYFCPIDADSASFPITGSPPDCFFCDAPDFDTSSYTSDCSDVHDAGSRCNITCRNDASVFSTFSCADSINDTHTEMHGVLPQCPVCHVLGNTNSLYDSSQCESQIAKGDSCTVRCADEPSIATLFECDHGGVLTGILPPCGRCAPLALDALIYDVGHCGNSLSTGDTCVANCQSDLKKDFQQFRCPQNANSTSEPLQGTIPQCFYCLPPAVDETTYVSRCAQTQDPGSSCNVECVNGKDAISVFTCPSDITSIDAQMSGSLESCAIQTHTISANVTGLDGIITIRLVNGQQQDLNYIISAENPEFSVELEANSSYAIEIIGQPTGQTCSISGGSGTLLADVTDVTITCVFQIFAISGVVSDLSTFTGSLTLANDGDEITLTEDGAFEFPSRVEYGNEYRIAVLSSPEGTECDIDFHSGIVTDDVSNIAVSCKFTGVCQALGHLDPLIYSGCDDEVRAGETCVVTCNQGGQDSTLTCPTNTNDGTLIGDLPDCVYCRKMEPLGPMMETNCTQSNLLVGESCYAQCAMYYESEMHWFQYRCLAQSGTPEIDSPSINCNPVPEEDVQSVVAIFETGKIVFSKSANGDRVEIFVELFGQRTYGWSLIERSSSCAQSKVFDPWMGTRSCASGNFTCRFGDIHSSHVFSLDDLSIHDIKSREVVLQDDSDLPTKICANAVDRQPESCIPLDPGHVEDLEFFGLSSNHSSTLCAKAYSQTSAVSEIYWTQENGEQIPSCVVAETECELLSTEEANNLLCLDYRLQVRYLEYLINGGVAMCEYGLTTTVAPRQLLPVKASDDDDADSLLFGLDMMLSLIILGIACCLLCILIVCLIRCSFQKKRLEHKRATLIKQMGSVIEMQNLPDSNFPPGVRRDSFGNDDAFAHTPGMLPAEIVRASKREPNSVRQPKREPRGSKRGSLRQSQRGSRFNLPNIEDAHGGGEIPEHLDNMPMAPNVPMAPNIPAAPGIPMAPKLPHLHTEPPYTPLMPNLLDSPDAAKPAEPDFASEIKLNEDDAIFGLQHKRIPHLRNDHPAQIHEDGDDYSDDEGGGVFATIPSIPGGDQGALTQKESKEKESYSFI